jgi:indoleamine 2,3-dioxygenase
MFTSVSAPQLSAERGFLPLNDPLLRLPHAFDAWESTAFHLPKLFASDHLRSTLGALPPFPLEEIASDSERERAMVLLSYLGHAYVWGGSEPATRLPNRLAVPWHAVAQSLGRPPVLSYASYALHNFYRFDYLREIECGNIALIQNFLGGIDEEWFILIHVDIERKAAPAMALLHECLDAAEAGEAEQLESLLGRVAASIDAMYSTLKRMPELCDPYVYYHRVRPYIHGWKNHPDLPTGLIYEGVESYGGQPQQFRGETGAQSAIVPSLDAMLGVDHREDMLRTYLMEMRTYMPSDHRTFIESLEARTSVRAFVQKADRTSLTRMYNACVEGLERFRSLHLEYAARYIFRQAQTDARNPHAVGTGGTPFMPYLTKHRDETGQQRLAEGHSTPSGAHP